MLVELRFIRHVVELARHGNYARAAHALNLSQSALSRSIATLESQLNVKLFDRQHQGVQPTAFGKLLLARGAALMTAESELRRDLVLLAGLEAGSLTVGVGPHPGALFLGKAVGHVLHSHPNLQLSIHSADYRSIGRRVLDGSLDLGVVNTGGWSGESRLSMEPLATLPLVIAARAGHPLARLRSLSVEQVLAFPIASPPVPPGLAEKFSHAYPFGRRDEVTGDLYTTLLVDSISMAQIIVEQCDAVMPVPLATIADAVRNKKLCVLDIHVPWLVVEFGAIHLSGCTPSPAAQSLLEALRRVASESLLEANHLAATLAIPHKPNVRLQPRSKLASVD
ncbi:MAG: LysR family transcriptional regulator [Steroidobacteraceae bacterium]